METVKKQILSEKREQILNIVIYSFLLTVFIGLFLAGNYGGGGDSESYLKMSITREPLYPTFLWILRRILGKDDIYMLLAFLQNLFAGIATVILVKYLAKKVFCNGVAKLISTVILTLPYLMTPFFSRTHLVMTNKVMAEGLTLPGYYLFVLSLLKIIYEEEKLIHNMVCAGIISGLLILAKGQMMLTVVILVIVVSIKLILQKKYRQIYQPVLAAIIVFVTTSLLASIYHYCVNGVFTGTASSKPMILANVLYVSEDNDGSTIDDADIKEVFERTYQLLDAENMLYKYAPDGMINKALHHEKYHDEISFDYFEPVKNDVYEDRMGDGYIEYMLFQDEVAAKLTGELIKNNWLRCLSNYINMCTLGFVRSIAIDHPVLNIYALMMYIMGAAILFFTWKKKGFTKEVFFFILTYIMITGFVTATSLFLQCITRYMIYNFPFFYIAGLALLCSWLPDKKRETEKMG